MTTEHLHYLIADVDRLLSETNSLVSSSTEQEQTRQVLLRVRAYLATLAQSSPMTQVDTPLSLSQDQWVEQITSAVISQINYQLADWFNTLETELNEVRRQRQFLLQDIQNLQQQYQKMIADFIQLLMKRSQDILQQQITQTQETIAQQFRTDSSTSIHSSVILEQLIQLQQHSDRLLSHLNTTFRKVFETLEQDLQEYSQSLSQGMERMHNLGQQGEVRLLAYINRLTEQLESPFPSISNTSIEQEEDLPVQTIHSLMDLINDTIQSVNSVDELQIIEQQISISNTQNLVDDGWYLGIDFGSTILTAVLSKINTQETEANKIVEYPLYWSSGDTSSFRLPTTAYSELENIKSVLNQSDHLSQDIQLVLYSLLTTLNSPLIDVQQKLRVMTNHLSESALHSALKELNGVIFSIPANWREPYCSQLKSAVLATNLVENETQIFFVEEAIATFLAHLPLATTSLSIESQTTLVINSGATTTDLALIHNVVNPIQTLSYDNFLLTTLAYGGNSFEQDIFCQLIYPQWFTQLNSSFSLLLEIIPQPGIADSQKREYLKQHLKLYPIGDSFIEAAKLAKLILQQQESFTSQLGNQTWTLQRHDVEKIVIYPFLQNLENHITDLLSQKNLSPQDIQQVITSGGTTLALWYSLSAWIHDKYPQARILHDSETDIISTVATGLARLPLFPNLLKTLASRNS